MRRLVCLGVMVSTGLWAACSSDSSPGGTGGAGGGGGGGAVAGTTGHGGAGGAGGQAAGGAAGQPTGGVGGEAAGGGAGQASGGAAGKAAGGAAGQAAGGAAGEATGGTAGQAAGGMAGQAAGGAAGGVGGVAGACLDPSMFSASFTIVDSTFCAVALYTASESLGSQAPTWGSHGGPLVVQAAATGTAGTSGTGVTLERWTAPPASTGAMTVQITSIASALPTGTFLGAQALDLPFFGWTAISWANPFPDTTGQFEMLANGAIVTSYDVNGPFGVTAVPAASSLGRLLYSGLSPLGMDTTTTNALYGADACSSPAQALGTGTGCSASAAVAAWGDSSGPVVADSNGDVFAVLNSFAAHTQEARGFLASSVARGSAATAGVTLFTLPGFSGSLAALSPTATDPGLVVLQPFDSTSFDALTVIEQKFTTSSSGLTAQGTATSLLTVPAGQMQGVALLVDGAQRLWVGLSGASSTTYVVLARQ
jgi:hypothetical protein